MDIVTFTLVLAIIPLLLYIYTTWSRNYFERKGVKSRPYSIPFLGNMCKVLIGKEHIKDLMWDTYRAFPDEKYVGHTQFNTHMIMIRDLDLLKQVTIKDFDAFTDHFGGLDSEQDALFGNNLFSLKGNKWKEMRANLSPAFTSSKMRNMFIFIDEIGKQLVEFYQGMMKEPENKERGMIEVEMKDVFSRYTNDVIATSVFGIKINSLVDLENEFYLKGKEASSFSGSIFIKFFILNTIPRIAKLFGMSLFSKEITKYYRNLVLGNIKEREEKNILRPDMIHLLMEARKGALKHDVLTSEKKETNFAAVEESKAEKQVPKTEWTDDETVAQAVLFFLAGFETSSTFLCFAAHELALNPEVQEKLQQEIDQVIATHGPKLEYNRMNEMKYLDMVVSETLRMWPPAPTSDRVCNRNYKLPPSNYNTPPYELSPGNTIMIPIFGIHHDPKYFPNPSKFDPERFSDENKQKIHPFSYMPFGVGPRNCIGSRFALMESKALLFHLLSKFDIVQTAKTQNPVVLKTNSFVMHSTKGFWFGLKPRST